MKDQLVKLLLAGFKVEFYSTYRRVEISEGVRDIQMRYCWKAHNEGKKLIYESDWDGFFSPEEAVDDFEKSYKDMNV